MYFDRRLWGFTKGVRLRILWAVFVGLASATVGVARLALLGWLLASIFAGESFESMIIPFAVVAAIMVLRGFLEYARNMVAHRTAAAVQLHIREQLYNKVVALGPAYFGQERTGDVILAMVDGVEQLEVYFGQYLPQLFISALTPIGIFAFVVFLDPLCAAILTGAALITMVAAQAFHRWDSRNSLSRSRAYKSFAAEFLDSVQGLGTLKSFGQSGARARMLAEKAHTLFRSTMWLLATSALSRGITDAGIAIGAAATLAVGAYRVADGAMSITALLIILMMGVEVFRPLRELRVLLHQGMVAQAASLGIFNLLDAKPPIAAPARPLSVDRIAPTIAFEHVGFSYPGGRHAAHRDLDFTVAEGERVGIVGPSGSGKSSIVKLLMRNYDPTEGTIRLGGHDMKALSFDDIHAQLAVVSQDAYLFHGTVEDNLRFGKPDATQAELEAAADAANAHEFIARLPQRYQTVIGERGIRLSGGQRQRIAIARALLRDAPILVLDEALSAVDAENEAVIQQALDRLMQGRTTLIFAHRLSSVIDADRILVLDEGHVAESGTHEALMARHGKYFTLMAAQAEGDDTADAPLEGLTADKPVLSEAAYVDSQEPTDSILRAEGLGWGQATVALFRHIMPYKLKLTATFLFGVARVVAFIGVGVVSALTVAAVKQGEPFDDLLILLAVLAPLAGILHWFESWIAHDMAFRLLANMRVALFKQLDRLAPAYLLRRRTGDLVAMATHDVELVEYFFAHTVAPAFVALLVPGVVVATLFAYGWPMAVALLPFLAIVALSPFFMRKRIDDLGSRAREALGDLNAFSVDTIQGLGEVVAFQQEKERGRVFLEKVEWHHRIRLPFFRDLTMQTAGLEAVTGLGGLVVVIVGAYLVSAGELDRTMLPMLSLLAMSAFLPISEIANIGRQLADTLGATRRLNAVEQETVPVTDGPGVPESDGRGASLELEGVGFSYFGANRLALNDVSLSVPAGHTVALVGASGAGKSTLAHLLMRFWDPDTGVVRMDGHDLRDFELDDLRSRIALVAQDTYLFNDTLAANIRIARPDATDAELMTALRRAALADFVDSMPDGLNMKVGERGMRLSGGQRQRVAIARAFLKDAPMLILDEATSHLDAVNEQAVRGALHELMTDRTTVIVAHRLSTIRNADQIVVMSDGRVVEAGSHEVLLARGGTYARLVARQISSAAAE
ncbi:MAG: ABC transporter ATP-binding protein [Alphaproteobacteria bacterium]